MADIKAPLDGELNPNHEVMKQARDQWHKLVGLLMLKFNMTDVEITMADIERLGQPPKAVVLDHRGGKMHIRVVPLAEGERLARTEGGMPV